MLKRILLSLLMFPLLCNTITAQNIHEEDAIKKILEGNIEGAITDLRLSLEKDSTAVLSQFALANQLFEKVEADEKRNRVNIRFVNMDGYFKDFKEAYEWSLVASENYKKLTEEEKKRIRQSLSVTGDEVTGFLTSRIQSEAFAFLNQAPYRRPTHQLYRTEVYNRIMEGDTLMALREIFIRQCGEYIDDYPKSPYLQKVNELRKGVLKEYLTNTTLRQYGDKSGHMFERYCHEIIELYPEEELKDLIPIYYGKEYGFSKENMYKAEGYKKLKSFADSEGLSMIEVLCQLNIHDGDCQTQNEGLYDRFIRHMAPMDIALIAVKKMTAPPFKAHNFTEVQNIYKKYKPLFPEQQKYFDSILELFTREETPRYLANLGNNVNTIAREYQPVITLDEEYLYFARKTAKSGEDVYVSKKDHITGEWGFAEEIFEVNTESHEVPLGVSGDGRTLLLYGNYSKIKRFSYVRNTESRLGKGDFYYSTKMKDGKWSAVNVFKYPINTPYYEAGLSLSLEGDLAFFTSDRPGGVGGYNPNYPDDGLYFHGSGEFNTDIYVSVKNEDGSWGEPINLGETINTPFAEKNPYLHPDKETLYFCSDGHPGLGGYDIFMAKRLDHDRWDKWSEPINLGISVNGVDDDAFYLTSVGDKALVVSSKEKENYGRDDIYELKIPEAVRPMPMLFAHGKVVDPDGEGIPELSIKVVSADGEEILKRKTADNGEFQIAVPQDQEYLIYVDDENYIGSSVELTDDPDHNLLLQPMETVDLKDESGDASFIMTSLNFDTNSSNIRSESFFDLDRLAVMMTRNQLWILVIEGHTDNVDTKEYNIELSKARANAVKQYLVNKGIHTSRLDAYGFGEERPIDSNSTKEGRQENRRVVFTILK
ncbi:OmpA family protein [Flammeovirga aprica]|uniref:OmpA family protein n=1 Tax=Flammeovirga aprica JL-4 TaxID=694437 RepID=A0A7X9XB64_9BACT|nr:OmpA family protein [Flammeovirga aprica]NME70406.1 OmpA family protein [Flammeovirga aprica JL-4]